MSDGTPREDERRRIFEQRIAPVLFPHTPTDGSPYLILLVAQPGAGATRAAGKLARTSGTTLLSAGDLRAFHPRFLELSRSRSPEALSILAESTTSWMQSALQYARTTRRSLLLDGSFRSPDIALATAGLFANSGFRTTVVVVATPRSESLLAVASRYLLKARQGRAARFTTVAEHDAGLEAARALVTKLEAHPNVDRLTIIGRDGTTRFDATRSDESAFAGARVALNREHVATMTTAQAMRWLSELRASTDFALSAGRVARPLAEELMELHEVGLREVVPNLSLPEDSEARRVTEDRFSRRVAELRQAILVERRPVPESGPVVSVPQPDRGISR